MADEIYYDPYDFEIDTDPYPIWKRLRDEAPLYYNEKYDFYAVSRFDDVAREVVHAVTQPRHVLQDTIELQPAVPRRPGPT